MEDPAVNKPLKKHRQNKHFGDDWKQPLLHGTVLIKGRPGVTNSEYLEQTRGVTAMRVSIISMSQIFELYAASW